MRTAPLAIDGIPGDFENFLMAWTPRQQIFTHFYESRRFRGYHIHSWYDTENQVYVGPDQNYSLMEFQTSTINWRFDQPAEDSTDSEELATSGDEEEAEDMQPEEEVTPEQEELADEVVATPPVDHNSTPGSDNEGGSGGSASASSGTGEEPRVPRSDSDDSLRQQSSEDSEE